MEKKESLQNLDDKLIFAREKRLTIVKSAVF